MRTTTASNRMATPRPKPTDLMIASGPSMKPKNTLIMISAAAVTTRAPWPKPLTTASRAEAPCTKSSRMRVTRNTW